ncbi:MAG: S1 RNA-binding domain-containing protein [Candidatus Thorarchaeota archaeon]
MPRRKKGKTKKSIPDEEEEEIESEEVVEEPEQEVIEKTTSAPIFSENDFPAKGELIIGKCTKITPHGAYFLLEGYEKLGETAGFVHISELSKTWIRNIRKHIKEGQKTVFKVLRINPQRAEVDLSIRRVTDAQKRNTLKVFKQEARAKTILNMVKEQFSLDEESYETLLDKLYSNLGHLYEALEKIRDNGSNIIKETGIDDKIADYISELAIKELERTSVYLSGKLKCSLYVKNGLEIFKDALNESSDIAKKNDATEVYIQNISAPDYRITIEAEDWKKAERSWKLFQDSFEKRISKMNPLILEFSRI